jgi:hypothetical protein
MKRLDIFFLSPPLFCVELTLYPVERRFELEEFKLWGASYVLLIRLECFEVPLTVG